MAADTRIADVLLPGEQLRDRVADASLILVDEQAKASDPRPGTLYLTDRRLLHIGAQTVAVDLAEIVEQTTAGSRLLLTLAGARGVMFDLPAPTDFRAQLAAAVTALRGQIPSR